MNEERVFPLGFPEANSRLSFVTYSAKKKKKCFTVGVAYKTNFSPYSVIVYRPGEGSSEKETVVGD